jgi:hypothetical protein
MLSFNISYPYLIKISYFMDANEKRLGGERKPNDKVRIG